MIELLEQLRDALLGLPPAAVYGIIGILAAVENIFPPIPADTAVAVGAFLSGGGVISPVAIFSVTWVSNVASALAVFGAASRYGRPFFDSRWGQRLMRPKYLDRIERMYHRFGILGIFLSRFVPGARAVVPPFAGVVRLGFWRTALPLATASGIWYGTITLLAATAVNELDELANVLRDINRAGVAGAAGIIALVSIAIVVRHRRRRVASQADRDG